jgi:hypothetical protein
MKSEGDLKMMKKLRHLGSKMALSALYSALLFASGQVGAASSVYKISVVASIPKGYAGEKLLVTQPSSTKFTPCTANKLDAVTFTVTYDAGLTTNNDVQDVYLILYSYNTDAIQNRFFTISKPEFSLENHIQINPYTDEIELDKEQGRLDDIYVMKEQNPGIGAITEPIFGGVINLEGAGTGTWQMVGIIANRSKIKFNDPKTWDAWDVATIVLGTPWALPFKPTNLQTKCL